MKKYKFFLFLLNCFEDSSLKTKLYLLIRIILIPNSFFNSLKSYFKYINSFIDVGCGYGIISLYALYVGFEGKIYGLDIDEKRINQLKEIVKKKELSNVTFEVRDFIKEGFTNMNKFDGAILVDILHHLDGDTQKKLLEHLSISIPKIIIKDIDTKPYWKYLRNYFHDKYIMNNSILCFLGSQVIKKYLEEYNYNIEVLPMTSLTPYPHYLLFGSK